jgi:hypothetical protein
VSEYLGNIEWKCSYQAFRQLSTILLYELTEVHHTGTWKVLLIKSTSVNIRKTGTRKYLLIGCTCIWCPYRQQTYYYDLWKACRMNLWKLPKKTWIECMQYITHAKMVHQTSYLQTYIFQIAILKEKNKLNNWNRNRNFCKWRPTCLASIESIFPSCRIIKKSCKQLGNKNYM